MAPYTAPVPCCTARTVVEPSVLPELELARTVPEIEPVVTPWACKVLKKGLTTTRLKKTNNNLEGMERQCIGQN